MKRDTDREMGECVCEFRSRDTSVMCVCSAIE